MERDSSGSAQFTATATTTLREVALPALLDAV